MSQFIRIRNAVPDTIGKATTNTSIQKPSEAPSKTKADSAQSPDRTRSDISGAILEVKDILNKQSEAISRLTIQTEALQHQQQHQQGYSSGIEDGCSWTDVVRRKPPRNEHRTEPSFAEKENTTKARWPRVKTRPTAILVDIDGQHDFSAVTNRIKSRVNQKTVGKSIIGMRKTSKGKLLLEVRGDSMAVDTVKAEIARAAGEDVYVRLLQQRSLIEIRDIDLWSERTDVVESLCRETNIPANW